MRGGYFFIKLLATAVAVASPLLAIHAWTLYSDLQGAQENAFQEVRAKSLSAARTVDGTLQGAERLLNFVTANSEVRSLVPARCNAFLRGLEAVDPVYAVVSVLDLTGQAFCISVQTSDVPASAGKSEWFTRVLAGDSYFLGQPAIGRITKRPVAPLTLPVRDDRGVKIAIAVVSLDLLRLEGSMVDDWPSEGGVLALMTLDYRFMIRSPDTTKWLGRNVSKAVQNMRESAQSPQAIVRALGVDGVDRVFATTVMSRYGLRVGASIPTTVVLGRAHAEIQKGIAVAAAALLLAGVLAYYGANSLSIPLSSLARTAREFALGHAGARADVSLPGEFKGLAVEMNSMYEARKNSELNALASEARTQRMSRFYEAVSRANQAIVRIGDSMALYDTICEVCVDTGQASMAWIGLVNGDRLEPVAWGGPAKEYTDAFEIRLSGKDPTPGGPGSAILSGECYVANDFINDPRSLRFRDNAAQYGVRAAAAVPFSRGGIVVGTLNVYANEVGFFDDELMRLLEAMGLDISFALDNYELAFAHQRTALELAKRESQLSGIVDAAMDAIITIDQSQRIVVFNNAASRLFMVPAALAVGKRIDGFMPLRYRAAHARQAAAYAVSEKEEDGIPSKKDSVREEVRAPRQLIGLRSDGTEFPIETSTFRSYEGNGVLITMVIRDVTGERDAERARLAAAESNAANRAKTEFLSRMSHELRTPLNAVVGFAQLLQDGTKERLTELERHQLDLILHAGTHLRALVDDVLDVAVVESGQLSLTLREFELKSLLDGVLRMSDASAKAGGINLIASYGPEALWLESDPIRLRQVALNLISNAIKYNSIGGSVTVSVQEYAAKVRIDVADTGLGMTQAQLSGLFEPFNRLGREHTGIAGTGIGMALVHELVELMGGTISVQSEAGVGTTVHVELPRPERGHPVAEERRRAQEPVKSNTAAIRTAEPSGAVLYIEDNPVNVLVIKHVLARWPAVQLVVAIDGESGIERATVLSPDVVLLDMGLPDMSGLDVLKVLRANTATRHLQIVALSASAMQHEVDLAMAAGAQGYWTKPIDVESFCAGMSKLLPGRNKPEDSVPQETAICP